MKKAILTLMVTLASVILTNVAIAADTVKFGIMAPRGALDAMKKWGPMGDYLSKEVGMKVELVPLKPDETMSAVADGQLDLVLANPVLTVTIKEKRGGDVLATMNGKSGSQFGGVIISKKGSGITKGEHLKGKKVMGFKFKRSAASYVFQVKHLMEQGVDAHKDFQVFKEAKKQDDIVLAVKSGVFDAGFIKSGLLEAMSKEGKVSMDDFEVVDRQNGNFAHVHSTKLYPEWCVTAMKNTDEAVKSKIKSALLKIKSDDPVGAAAKIVGFVEPLSLDELTDTLKTLKLPPFDN